MSGWPSHDSRGKASPGPPPLGGEAEAATMHALMIQIRSHNRRWADQTSRQPQSASGNTKAWPGLGERLARPHWEKRAAAEAQKGKQSQHAEQNR